MARPRKTPHGSGSKLGKAAVAERRTEALNMRMRGETYQAIMAKLHYSSVSAVATDIDVAVKMVHEREAETAARYRAFMMARTEQVACAMFALAMDEDQQTFARTSATLALVKAQDHQVKLIGTQSHAGKPAATNHTLTVRTVEQRELVMHLLTDSPTLALDAAPAGAGHGAGVVEGSIEGTPRA